MKPHPLFRLRRVVAGVLAAGAPSLAWAAESPSVVRQTLLQKLNMPTIYILLVCSMLIVWLVLDIGLKAGVAKLIGAEPLEALRGAFRRGDYQGAFDYCRARPGPLTHAVGAALRHAASGSAAAEDAAVAAIAAENGRFQSKIAYLSVIGVIAPMIGLAGTVFGMIDAFAVMGQAGAADPSKLSAAIGKVLYATAGGLVVAIPAFVCYYLLRNRTARAIHALHETVADLFRRFPYDALAGRDLAGGEAYAAAPVWREAPSAAESKTAN